MRGDQHPIPIYLIVLTQTLSGLTQLDKVGTAVLKLESGYLRLRGGRLPIPGELEFLEATIATRQERGSDRTSEPLTCRWVANTCERCPTADIKRRVYPQRG